MTDPKGNDTEYHLEVEGGEAEVIVEKAHRVCLASDVSLNYIISSS
jgi:hypothetical protein